MAENKISFRVYYEDTDFSGVVYHARYLQFLERGRTEALRAVGVSHTDLLARDEPLALAVRRMDIEWLAPARIDDMIEVRTIFEATRGARMFLSQSIWRGADCLATARVEAVAMTLAGRARRLPEEIAAKFAST